MRLTTGSTRALPIRAKRDSDGTVAAETPAGNCAAPTRKPGQKGFTQYAKAA